MSFGFDFGWWAPVVDAEFPLIPGCIGLAIRAGTSATMMSAYDAFYVAVVPADRVPLMTVDGRLSRAPDLGVVVQHERIG